MQSICHWGFIAVLRGYVLELQLFSHRNKIKDMNNDENMCSSDAVDLKSDLDAGKKKKKIKHL